ncbi:MAG: hypothetical protein ACFNUS_00580 [Candidatus Saccharimonas sp.]
MRFFVRLFIEIALMIFVVITATRVLSEEHPGVAGMVLVAIYVVILALRATIQREMIKDDADQRRRLERAFISAASEAGWPRLVKVDRGRKVVSYYIRVPYRPNDDFYFEFPLEEERLAEPIQLVDILPKEDVDEFYGVEEDKEVNTDTAEDKDEE